MVRLRAAFGSILVLALLALAPAPSVAAPVARPFGAGPLNDVVAAANAVAASQSTCGATANQLAAMAMAMVFHETGATGSTPPSPMTLSRWDVQPALFAFGDSSPGNPYRRAFFHPGVGMWQFDSAGLGQPHAAGYYMHTATAAPSLLATIRSRWCSASAPADPVERRRFVWQPWHACTKLLADGRGVCEAVYQEIFDGANLRNLTTFANVSSTGGMQARRCFNGVTGVVVDCFYVNPAAAEGDVGWTASPNGVVNSSGVTVRAPLSLPFYVYEHNGVEHRHWITADTGFVSEIRASRPLNANARTGLTWSSGPTICDVTANRGSCPGLPPVGPTVAPLPADPGMVGAGRGPGLSSWNGSLGIAERRSDGSVLVSSLVAPLWSGHTSFGGQTLTDPDAVSLGGDHFGVFVLGGDRAVYHGAWQQGAFTGWSSLGGRFSSGPSAVASGPDRIDVVGRGADGAYWTGTLRNGTFSGWSSIGGGFRSEPTVASWGNGRLDVFGIGGDRALWHRAFDGTAWGPWESLGGSLTSAPGAASGAVNLIDIAARGADGSVWLLRWTGAWSWTPLGGSVASAPDVSATSGGATVVARAANGSLYRIERAGSSFSAWSPVP